MSLFSGRATIAVTTIPLGSPAALAAGVPIKMTWTREDDIEDEDRALPDLTFPLRRGA